VLTGRVNRRGDELFISTELVDTREPAWAGALYSSGEGGYSGLLPDGGAVKEAFGELYQKYEGLASHWAQFAEVTAQTFYDLMRFNRVPKFMLIEGNGACAGGVPQSAFKSNQDYNVLFAEQDGSWSGA